VLSASVTAQVSPPTARPDPPSDVFASPLAGHPRTVPTPGTGPAQAPASAASGITSLAGVPSDPGTRTPPPPFYVSIVTMGLSRNGRELVTAQVRRTSDGQVTGTVPALPAGWTLVADYQWKLAEGPADLAVLGLDATSSGGSLQAHSHLLFSQGDHCTVCVYTALTSTDGSTLTAVAASSAPPQNHRTGVPWHRLYVLRLSLVTGQPSGILYRSAGSVGSYNVGLVPVLSADGQAQHWFLVLDPEHFGWISGGKLVPLPIKASAGLLAIGWTSVQVESSLAPGPLVPRIVVRVQVFQAQQPDRGDLGDVLTGSGPVEVRDAPPHP
jgi:hypothetical protein